MKWRNAKETGVRRWAKLLRRNVELQEVIVNSWAFSAVSKFIHCLSHCPHVHTAYSSLKGNNLNAPHGLKRWQSSVYEYNFMHKSPANHITLKRYLQPSIITLFPSFILKVHVNSPLLKKETERNCRIQNAKTTTIDICYHILPVKILHPWWDSDSQVLQ